MSAIRPAKSYSALRSITLSTTTGTDGTDMDGNFTQTAMQIVPSATGASGSARVDGSMDGTNWTTLIAATTYADSAVVAYSTAAFLLNHLRAHLVTSSTIPVSVWITGR